MGDEMGLFIKAKFFVAFAVAVLLAGCAKHQIPFHSFGYNEALYLQGNQQILLNIVRAAKRQPMYFTGVQDVSFSDSVDISLGASTTATSADEFRNGSVVSSVKPSLAVNDGFSSFKASNLNTAKFATQLLEPISATTFQYLAGLRIPSERLLYLFVDSITLSEDDYQKIMGNAEDHCLSVPEDDAHDYCMARRWDQINNLAPLERQTHNSCEARRPKARTRYYDVVGKGNKITQIKTKVRKFRNGGRGPCDRLLYSELVRALVIGDVEITGIRNAPDQVEKRGPFQGIRLSVFDTEDNEVNLGFGTEASKTKFQSISLRSPEGVLYYLGEILAIDQFQNDGHVPRIFDDPMFEVEVGATASSQDVAIAYEGDVFHIDNKRRPDRQENLSMSIMTLLQLLIQLQTNENRINPDQTITLVTSN